MTPSPHPPLPARRSAAALAGLLLAMAATLGPTPAPAGAVEASDTATGRVSVTTAGAEKAHDEIGAIVQASGDGRFVAFTTTAALVAGDTNGADDVYLRDRLGGTTVRVSLTDADGEIDGRAAVCGMSRDARYVAFSAWGHNLPGEGDQQIYLRDRQERTTTLVSVSSAEVPVGIDAIYFGDRCPVSDDGRYVAFQAQGSDLAPHASGDGDVYRRDRQTGTTQLVNASMFAGGEPNGSSWDAAMSADGTTVAFTSEASNLVTGDSNGDADVFVRSFASNATYRMSVKPGGGQVQGASGDPSISANGAHVAFTSSAADLVAGDGNGYPDVFVRHRVGDTVVRASLGSEGELGSGGSSGDISDDGRFVTFAHYTPSELPGDTNHDDDVLRRDLQAGSTVYVSVARTGAAGDDQSYVHDSSADGRAVAFVSSATNLVRNDTNGTDDVFVRDYRVETTPFADRSAFITQQFQDFAGRAPTGAELEAWLRRLDHGEVVPEQVVDQLAHSTTWAGRRAPVIRLYWAFFLRVPDKAGMDYWIGQAQAGLSLPKMASKFAASSEFKAKYGPLSTSAFVTKVYDNVLDRSPDPAGLAYWKAQIDTGKKTRGDVMVGFSESPEGRDHIAPVTDTVLFWTGMLRTVPSGAAVAGAQYRYALGEPPEAMVQIVLLSDTYAARLA